MEFAHHIQPWLSKSQLQEIADALNGTPESQNCSVTVPSNFLLNAPYTPTHHAPSWDDMSDINNMSYDSPSVIFVDYVQGNDAYNGTITFPIKHLHTAMDKLRGRFGNKYHDIDKQIVLRKGTHYIPKMIQFGSEDSNLLLTNYNNEHVILSAGIPLDGCSWKKYKHDSDGLHFYQCKLPENSTISDITGLRVNGKRMIRARYPNGDPEYYPCGFCSNVTAHSWSKPTRPYAPEIVINPIAPGIVVMAEILIHV